MATTLRKNGNARMHAADDVDEEARDRFPLTTSLCCPASTTNDDAMMDLSKKSTEWQALTKQLLSVLQRRELPDRTSEWRCFLLGDERDTEPGALVIERKLKRQVAEEKQMSDEDETSTGKRVTTRGDESAPIDDDEADAAAVGNPDDANVLFSTAASSQQQQQQPFRRQQQQQRPPLRRSGRSKSTPAEGHSFYSNEQTLTTTTTTTTSSTTSATSSAFSSCSDISEAQQQHDAHADASTSSQTKHTSATDAEAIWQQHAENDGVKQRQQANNDADEGGESEGERLQQQQQQQQQQPHSPVEVWQQQQPTTQSYEETVFRAFPPLRLPPPQTTTSVSREAAKQSCAATMINVRDENASPPPAAFKLKAAAKCSLPQLMFRLPHLGHSQPQPTSVEADTNGANHKQKQSLCKTSSLQPIPARHAPLTCTPSQLQQHRSTTTTTTTTEQRVCGVDNNLSKHINNNNRHDAATAATPLRRASRPAQLLLLQQQRQQPSWVSSQTNVAAVGRDSDEDVRRCVHKTQNGSAATTRLASGAQTQTPLMKQSTATVWLATTLDEMDGRGSTTRVSSSSPCSAAESYGAKVDAWQQTETEEDDDDCIRAADESSESQANNIVSRERADERENIVINFIREPRKTIACVGVCNEADEGACMCDACRQQLQRKRTSSPWPGKFGPSNDSPIFMSLKKGPAANCAPTDQGMMHRRRKLGVVGDQKCVQSVRDVPFLRLTFRRYRLASNSESAV